MLATLKLVPIECVRLTFADAVIEIMSTMNLGKSSAPYSTPAIGFKCNAQQCLPMKASDYLQ